MPWVIVPIVAGLSWVFGLFTADSFKGIAWLISLAVAASLILGVI